MSDLEALMAQIRAHPAFHGGQADETYVLDWLELALSLYPEGLDTLAEVTAGVRSHQPERWPVYTEASREDLLASKVVQALIRLVRTPDGFVPEPLNSWALDVATGVRRQQPPDESDARKQGLRNAAIVWAVHSIREVSGIPYEFHEPKSGSPKTACHVVAERLGWKFGKVRTIWRNGRSLFEPSTRLRVGLSIAKSDAKHLNTPSSSASIWGCNLPAGLSMLLGHRSRRSLAMTEQSRMLRRAEVEKRCGISRSSIYRLMRRGMFPEPVQIGPKAVRWPEAEISAWLAGRPRATGEAA